MTSNSTTPDSPQCPTCGSDNKLEHRGYTSPKDNLKHLCADPFHTSLPTAPAREGVVIDEMDSVRQEALRFLENKGKVKSAEPRVSWGDIAGWIAYFVINREAATPSETRAGEQEGSTAHLAIDCTSRYCAEHRDTWHHYEKAIATPVQTGEGSTLTQQEKVNRAANNAFDAAVAIVGGSTGPDTPRVKQ